MVCPQVLHSHNFTIFTLCSPWTFDSLPQLCPLLYTELHVFPFGPDLSPRFHWTRLLNMLLVS